LTACDAAVADVATKVREAAGVAPDGDPLEALFADLPEIEVLLPASMRAPRQAPDPHPAETEDHDG